MKKCLNCNKEFSDNDEYCPDCGIKIEEKKIGIPLFMGFKTPVETGECENGVCSFDKNKK
ncbi:hypothetical protein JXR93_14015 [bacterium]|nr:hypothetical protein [bacterium]